MCGILLVARGVATISKLEADQVYVVPLSERLSASDQTASLHRRGPDSWGIEQVVLGPVANLQIQGSLLQLRGNTPGVTPVKDGHGSLLVLNGEVFGGLDIAPGCSDSQALLQALTAGKAPDVFNCLRGPWAAVYWHADTRTLWFGRDVLGRRSLLMHLPISPDDCFCLVSAAAAALVANLDGKTWSAERSQGSQAADQSGAHEQEKSSMQHSTLQELRPGLYSMHFPASESAPMTAELKYHPWQDPLLCSIRNFQRPQAFITPHTAPTTAAAPVAATTAAATAAAKASLSTDAAPVGAAAPLMDAQPDMEMYSSAQFDQAVELTLTALARAVAVRCLCIDQHSPHLHGDKASGKHSLGHGHSLSGKHSQHSHGHGQIHVHKSCTQGSGQFNTGALQTVASTFDTSSPQVSAGDHCSDGPRQCTSSTAQLSQLQTHASQAALALLSQPELSHTPHDRAQTNSEKATSSCKQPQSSRHSQQQSQPGHQETQCQLRPAPVLILFSGGVDSTLIAALAHQSLPVDVPIDLASVCFNEGRSADRLAAQDALLELMQFAPTREWRLIQVDSSLEEVDQHRNWLLGLLHPSATVMDLNIGAALWMAARAEGKVTVAHGASPSPSNSPSQSTHNQQPSTHDSQSTSTHPLVHVTETSGPGTGLLSADCRIESDKLQTCDTGTTELCAPQWQLQHHLQLSGPDAECCRSASLQQADPAMDGSPAMRHKQAARDDAPSSATCHQAESEADPQNLAESERGPQYPAESETGPQNLVESEAGPQSLAESEARPQNLAESVAEPQHQQCSAAPASPPDTHGVHGKAGTTSYEWYRSAARVVLLGHGADEQHAGYGRHRTSFRNHGWTGLQEELAIDMQRLWQRNLGRDDRLVADTSREARHPFLDEDYIHAVLQLPLWLVANLKDAPGQGDKLLLRAALRRLGLPRAAARVKRAIQFGTGIGKLSNVRSFGSNRAANSRNAGSLDLMSLQHV